MSVASFKRAKEQGIFSLFSVMLIAVDKSGERNKEQHINVRKFNVKRVNGNEIGEKGMILPNGGSESDELGMRRDSEE